MDRNHNLTQYITGIKGWAALFIFITHVGGPLATFFPVFDEYYKYGNFAVMTFYMISAFTITLGFLKSNVIDYLSYMIKRVSRIVPLYYFILIPCFIFYISPWKNSIYPRYDFRDLFLHLTFLNIGEINYRYQNSIIGTEWYVTISMYYYIFLPFIYRFLKNKFTGIVLILTGSILYFNSDIYNLYKKPDNIIGFHWSLQKYLFPYVISSILAFSLFEKKHKLQKNQILMYISLSTAVIPGLIYQGQFDFVYSVLFSMVLLFSIMIKSSLLSGIRNKIQYILIDNIDHFLIFGLTFKYFLDSKTADASYILIFITLSIIGASRSRSIITKIFFENPIIVYIGTICYSFYLLQFPVIQFANRFLPVPERANYSYRWMMIFGILTLVSSLTYFIIEKKLSGFIYSKLKKLYIPKTTPAA